MLLTVQCMRGAFHQIRSNRCERCDVGYFSALNGQTSCQQCPINQSTKMKGAKSIEECISMLLEI